MKSIGIFILGIISGVVVVVLMLFSSVAFLFNRFGEDQPIVQKAEMRVETAIKQANFALDGAENKYIKDSNHSTCKCNGTKVIVHGDGHKTPCLCNPCKCSQTPPAVPYADSIEMELEGTVEALKVELQDSQKENQKLKSQIESLSKQSVATSDLLRKLANAEDSLKIETDQKNKLSSELNIANQQNIQFNEKITKINKDLDVASKELDLIKKQKTLSERKSQLLEAGIVGEELTSTLKKFENVSDEIFKNILTTIKKEVPQGN